MFPERHPGIAERLREAGCVYAEDEARILASAATSPSDLDELVRRRTRGEPVEYIVGWAEFRGLRVAVRPGVFVPRRRTEFMAECAVQLAREAVTRVGSRRTTNVLDLCCGSGVLALVMASEVAGVRVWAADSSPDAVECARENLDGRDCVVLLGDLFDPLRGARAPSFDVIACNAPYVPTGEIGLLPAEARCFEALPTLDGGTDGLAIQRRVFDGAHDWLAADGRIVVETSHRQASATEQLAVERDFAVDVRRMPELEAVVVIARVA